MTVFLDTNILLYSISTNPAERAKREIALSILADRGCVLSVQVLQEFLVQATRASRADRIAMGDAFDLISGWRRFPVQAIDLALFDAARDVQRRTNYSWWDCAIVAAALAIGCGRLLSEDMEHGRILGTLRIENPFLATG